MWRRLSGLTGHIRRVQPGNKGDSNNAANGGTKAKLCQLAPVRYSDGEVVQAS